MIQYSDLSPLGQKAADSMYSWLEHDIVEEIEKWDEDELYAIWERGVAEVLGRWVESLISETTESLIDQIRRAEEDDDDWEEDLYDVHKEYDLDHRDR